MSSHAVRVRGARSVLSRSVYRRVEATRAKKRRQPTADTETATLAQSSSAPSLAVAASAATAASVASLAKPGERAVMATVCAIAAHSRAGPHSSAAPPSTSPCPSDAALTPAVVLSAPAAAAAAAGWTDRTSKRSKTPVLASPWSGQSHASLGDWMPQLDGASPASSTCSSSSSSQPFYPMHRRSSLPCFPFPASSFPGTPTSGSSSQHSFPPVPPLPAGPSRLQSAPSAIRSLSHSPPLEQGGVTYPLDAAAGEMAAAGGAANLFASLQLRLAAHPVIRRLQQLDEAHDDERQVDVGEDDDEDSDDDEAETAELAEQPKQQPPSHQAQESPMMPVHAEVLSALPLTGLPVVDEAEHAPLAGLVTAFPFVQQFIPQPTRAEKKKKFIERIHASHQLTITNSYPAAPTNTNATKPAPPPLPLHAALPTAFRSMATSPTLSSDDSQEELSSENDSCSHTDCSSSALADTFASMSPNFHAARPSGFLSPLPPPSATFLLTPQFSFVSSTACAAPYPFPAHLLPSPALLALQQPACVRSPASALLECGDLSLCPDDLQLGEPAWGSEDGQWMGDW